MPNTFDNINLSSAHLRASARDRYDAGRSRRESVPLKVHAEVGVNADRVDPLDILALQDKSRLPEFISLRYGRMNRTPFTFLRGRRLNRRVDGHADGGPPVWPARRERHVVPLPICSRRYPAPRSVGEHDLRRVEAIDEHVRSQERRCQGNEAGAVHFCWRRRNRRARTAAELILLALTFWLPFPITTSTEYEHNLDSPAT